MFRTNSNLQHNHETHQFLAEYEICYAKLKSDVDKTSTSVRELHKSYIRRMSREAAGLMSFDNVKGTLNRIRRLKMPPCHSINDLDQLLNENDFVFNNYGMVRQKAFYNGSISGQMFFSNPELIANLEPNFSLFVDGTFNVVPYNQEQLLVVMATLLDKPRPIVFVIMSHRTEAIYTEVFRFIKNVIFPVNKCFYSPQTVSLDFEMAMRNAVRNIWPQINVSGCNFHFCQALRRKASTIDYLFEAIERSPKHKEILMMFMRSSLLPLEMVYDGIDAIKNVIENDSELLESYQEFINYFNYTWINRYPPTEWCVSGQRYRTNNHVEGYNSKIKKWIPINPSPFKFLESLQDLAYDADAEFQNAKLKSIVYKDSSRLTPHLHALLPKLQEGIIDELEFVSMMASV
ncbi:uncharacterized protein [Chironomus tepperi]|uniref:uncharacterized protein n=1 Tax=Chironomus tepperi TaxID=113505 RepID=UPI00391F65AC